MGSIAIPVTFTQHIKYVGVGHIGGGSKVEKEMYFFVVKKGRT